MLVTMMEAHGVDAVGIFGDVLQQILQRATEIKTSATVEPPLSKSDYDDLLSRIDEIDGLQRATNAESLVETEKEKEKRSMRFAIIETAIRDTFNDLLASSDINTPGFVLVWNLLDIVAILSDNDQCDPALMFWLVEELLDSQTIDGCRKVFDYLESRRERITARHFKQKNLVILRSCNELLRRLSRAEDTAFCGRVFIFLFQSFPLGDKSSVNLRGEYHVENVTTFDQSPDEGATAMEVDSEGKTDEATADTSKDGSEKIGDGKPAKSVSFDSQKAAEQLVQPDTLYPVFWALQQSFSQPKKLFDKDHFKKFKEGLEATVTMFKSVKTESNRRSGGDDTKKGVKRKRSQDGDDLAATFNPKYLTSRDLFELEISDLSFRRHVLVQALIIMDFLLSLSSKAKQKLSTVTAQNKSVMYQDQTLDDEDVKWAQTMKSAIADYLKRGSEGPFFYRMVETVLSRDKNWVRWKVENCPPIIRPPIASETYLSAKQEASKATANKRLRPKPMGSLDLSFMTDSAGAEKLKDTSRSAIPDVKTFKNAIALDDMDLDMAEGAEKKKLIESKASKSWRALRIARTSKLVVFDRIDNADKIDIVFDDLVREDDEVKDAEATGEGEEVTLPSDRRPVVITGPTAIGKSAILQLLLEKQPKVFTKVLQHSTSPSNDGPEVYEHVDAETFNMLRDSDAFLAFSNFDGYDYGVSRRSIEDISSSAKVAVLELDADGVRQLKENTFDARFVFLTPESITDLEQSLRERDNDSDEKIQARIQAAEMEIENSKKDGYFDKIIVTSNHQDAMKALTDFIFSSENSVTEPAQEESKESLEQSVDTVPMETDEAPAPTAAEKATDKEDEKLEEEQPKYSRIEVVDMSR